MKSTIKCTTFYNKISKHFLMLIVYLYFKFYLLFLLEYENIRHEFNTDNYIYFVIYVWSL